MIARLWWLVDRRALLVTAGCLVAWRLLNQVPVIDISRDYLSYFLGLARGPGMFAAIGSNSIVAESYDLNYLGIYPYILALVVVSLVSILSVRVKEMIGTAQGRIRLERWIRAVALLLALGGATSWTHLAQNAGALPDNLDWFARLAISLEMAAATGVMILLAGVLDEHGLGFGYGAVIFYALDILANGLHKLADYFASAPSIDALYKPVAIWAAFTLAVTVASVAILLAFRRVHAPNKVGSKGEPVDLKLVIPGVLRPGLFTFLALGTPSMIARYVSSDPSAVRWFVDNWTPYGSAMWLDITYVVLEAALVIGFAVVIAIIDFSVADGPAALRANVIRLAAISGVLLALLIAVARVANHLATEAAGQLIQVSGFDVLLVVAMVLVVVLWIEGRGRVAPLTTTPALLP